MFFCTNLITFVLISFPKSWKYMSMSMSMSRSGHQRRFVDPISEKFAITPELEFFTDQFLLFRFSWEYHHAQFVYLRICISVTWGQVRFMILTLRAYGKILKCAQLRVNGSKPPNSFSIMTDYLICDDPGVTYWQGHRERSSDVMEVISSLLPINHDTMVLKTCKRYQTARLVKTRRLKCSMTIIPAPHWVMTWPRPEVKFKLSYGSHNVHTCFESSRREKHNGANPMSLSVLVQKLYRLQFQTFF